MELSRICENLLEISKQLALLQNYISIKFGADWTSDFKEYCKAQETLTRLTADVEAIRSQTIQKEQHLPTVKTIESTNITIPPQIPEPNQYVKQESSSLSADNVDNIVYMDSVEFVEHFEAEDNPLVEPSGTDCEGSVLVPGGQDYVGVDVEDVESFQHFSDVPVGGQHFLEGTATRNQQSSSKTVHLMPKPVGFKRKMNTGRIQCSTCHATFTRNTSLRRHIKNTACAGKKFKSQTRSATLLSGHRPHERLKAPVNEVLSRVAGHNIMPMSMVHHRPLGTSRYASSSSSGSARDFRTGSSVVISPDIDVYENDAPVRIIPTSQMGSSHSRLTVQKLSTHPG